MNKLKAPFLVAAFVLSATMAQAGGPVIVEDSTEVLTEGAGSSIGVLPVILVAVALCAALCGNDDPGPKKGCTGAAECL